MFECYVFFCILKEVEYSGDEIIRDGEPWQIECRGFKGTVIRWTRNQQSLETELSSGLMKVDTNLTENVSKLTSQAASQNDDGAYKCTNDSSYHELQFSVG